jgi:hypothetical protein
MVVDIVKIQPILIVFLTYLFITIIEFDLTFFNER